MLFSFQNKREVRISMTLSRIFSTRQHAFQSAKSSGRRTDGVHDERPRCAGEHNVGDLSMITVFRSMRNQSIQSCRRESSIFATTAARGTTRHVHCACGEPKTLVRALAVEGDAGEAHLGGINTVDAFAPNTKPDVALGSVRERERRLHQVDALDDRQAQRREEEHWENIAFQEMSQFWTR